MLDLPGILVALIDMWYVWKTRLGCQRQDSRHCHWECYKQLKSAMPACTTELRLSSDHWEKELSRWCKGWCCFYVLVWLAGLVSNCV